MKATGIVRRIDDLGRIVIPKEIRKTLKINEGNPLEIFTDAQGNVIFKKYSPVGEMTEIAETYASTISKVLSCACIISDTDKVVAVSGSSKKELSGKNITDKLRDFLSYNRHQVAKESIQICDSSEKSSEYIATINASGDTMGCIIVSDFDNKKDLNMETYMKTTAQLLANQIE